MLIRICILCLGLASSLTAARTIDPNDIGGGHFITRKNTMKPKVWDQNELQAAVEETQSMADGLARESLGLGPEAKEALFEDLKEGFKLPKTVKAARKTLAKAEETVSVQASIKALQGQLQGLSGTAADQVELQLLESQDTLIGAVNDLQDLLVDLHKDLKEGDMRKFRSWLMVSEGRLRREREVAQTLPAATIAVTPTVTIAP